MTTLPTAPSFLRPSPPRHRPSSSSRRRTNHSLLTLRLRPPSFLCRSSPNRNDDFTSFQVDSVKLIDLLAPDKVDPSDVHLIKANLFGYSTFWLTNQEPFGDLAQGVLFLGNLRGNREDVFAKLSQQLRQLTGDKYNLFMLEEPNSEGPDPRGGPRVSFALLRKEVSEPGPTTLWQYVISVLLFLLTVGSSPEFGIASQAYLSFPHITTMLLYYPKLYLLLAGWIAKHSSLL